MLSSLTIKNILLIDLVELEFKTGLNTLTGETGVGKSVGIQQFLNTCGESYAVTTANFSAQTSSGNVVDIFENSLGPVA